MQNWVANAILKRKTGVEDASIVTVMTPFPIQPIISDNFARVLNGSLNFFMLLMYIPAIYRTVYRVVAEKASRAKESMRMMGMNDFPYWFSWYVYFTMVNFCLCFFTFIILYFGVFRYSSPVLLFALFFLFGQSLFGLILVA
jgi:ATP-binding cassette, subfamily A (ABC1), member 3